MRRPTTPAGRVGRGAASLTAAGVVLFLLGALGLIAVAASSDWALLVLSVLAILVGGFVAAAGVGLRRVLAQSELRAAGVRIDAEAAAVVEAQAITRAQDCAAGGVGGNGGAADHPGARGSSGAQRPCGPACDASCALSGRAGPGARLSR